MLFLNYPTQQWRTAVGGGLFIFLLLSPLASCFRSVSWHRTSYGFLCLFPSKKYLDEANLLSLAEATDDNMDSCRRKVLGQSLAFLSSVPYFGSASSAAAASNTTTDWDAFGQLQMQAPGQSNLSPQIMPFQQAPTLEQSLQDRSRQRSIDPRTHG